MPLRRRSPGGGSGDERLDRSGRTPARRRSRARISTPSCGRGGQPVVVDPARRSRRRCSIASTRSCSPAVPTSTPRATARNRIPTVYGVDRAADDVRARARADAALDRGDPDARDLPRAPGAQRRARRHAAPAPPRTSRASNAHGRPGRSGRRVRAPDRRRGRIPCSRRCSAPTRVTGSCHHHQAVAKLGDGLRVTATAADGIVEGLELDGAWRARGAVAPRGHRRSTTASQQRLFDALVDPHADRSGSESPSSSGERRLGTMRARSSCLGPCRSGCAAWRR